MARQARRMESEVDDALEPLRSDEASSQRLHVPVGPFCRKGRLPKTSLRPSRPSGHASGPRPGDPRDSRGGHPWAKILVLLVLLGLPAGAQAPFPAPQGRVNDFAQVLDPATKAQLNALVAEVEQRTTAEIAVVVVHTTAPMTPKEYVTALFNRWGVGKRGTR